MKLALMQTARCRPTHLLQRYALRPARQDADVRYLLTMQPDHKLSRLTLRFDGIFLAIAGSAAMITETVGYFFGRGPMAATLGSPYTIGGFEAHGLAMVIAVLLLRASARPDRRLWHVVGLSVHVLLGSANILFWSSFVQQDLLLMRVITTALHILFVAAHAICMAARTESA